MERRLGARGDSYADGDSVGTELPRRASASVVAVFVAADESDGFGAEEEGVVDDCYV